MQYFALNNAFSLNEIISEIGILKTGYPLFPTSWDPYNIKTYGSLCNFSEFQIVMPCFLNHMMLFDFSVLLQLTMFVILSYDVYGIPQLNCKQQNNK